MVTLGANPGGAKEQMRETEIAPKPLMATIAALDQTAVSIPLTHSKLHKLLLHKKANGPDLIVVPCKHNSNRKTEYVFYERRWCKKSRRKSSAGTMVREPYSKTRNELDHSYEEIVKHYTENGNEVSYALTKLQFKDVPDAYEDKLVTYKWTQKNHPELKCWNEGKELDTIVLDINSLKATLPVNINEALLLWRDNAEATAWLASSKSFKTPEGTTILHTASEWSRPINPNGSPPTKSQARKRAAPMTPAKPIDLEETLKQAATQGDTSDTHPGDEDLYGDIDMPSAAQQSDADDTESSDSSDEEDNAEEDESTPQQKPKKPKVHWSGKKPTVTTTASSADWHTADAGLQKTPSSKPSPRTRSPQ
jgi:hypothetical protein